MKMLNRAVVSAALLAGAVLGQSPQELAEQIRAEVNIDLDQVQEQVEQATKQLKDLNLGSQLGPKLGAEIKAKVQASLDMARAKRNIAMAQAGSVRFGTDAYERGKRALDDHKYEDAIRFFDAVVSRKQDRADGALYWKAYALNRAGRKDEALAALATLKSQYSGSRWLGDAQTLEAEAKAGSGPITAEAQSNEDVKLMAINGLMNADPDRAIPLLENLLKGNAAPRVKDRAMFVLSQSKAPRASQLLTEYAKGAGNPDLQLHAVRYVGMSGTPETQQLLAGLYGSTGDLAVKSEILRWLMVSKNKDALFNLAKVEKNTSLRQESIRHLGALKATDQLAELYSTETETDAKVQIIRSLGSAGASEKLLALAKTEKDEKVRSQILRSVAGSRNTPADVLAQLYGSASDAKGKREVVDGLAGRNDAKALVELARKESDPEIKKFIVSRLAGMKGKEATDYMMELLK